MGTCIGSSTGVSTLDPICGRDSSTVEMYNALSSVSECDDFLETVCDTDKVQIATTILAEVAASELADFLDSSNQKNIDLRASACTAVLDAINSAVGNASPQAMSTSPSTTVTFSCAAIISAASPSNRLRSLSASASIQIGTTVTSDQELPPETASLVKQDIVQSEQAIGDAVIAAANSQDGVSADANQDVTFQATTDLAEEDQEPTSGGDDGLSTGAIIGIAVGALAGVAVVAATVATVIKKKSQPLAPEKTASMKLKSQDHEQIAKNLN